MKRIVLDTNILVSALRSRRGASFYLVSRIPSKAFEIAISVPLYIEYQDVLHRREKVPGFKAEDIRKFLRYLCQVSHHQEIFYLWRPYLRDPKDDMVLELAVASESDFIVTHNKKDFQGSEAFGVEVICPQEFIQKIRR